jgi:hypothetical protein
MKFFQKSRKNLSFLEKKVINFFKIFQKNISFEVFIDLNLLRGRKFIKLFSYEKKTQFFIGSIKSGKKRKEFNLEVFLPIPNNVKININTISEIFDSKFYNNKIFNYKTMNLAFVDSGNTIAYYRLDRNLHKTSGPLF